MKNRAAFFAFLAASALTLSACEVGPDYAPPKTATPQGWDAEQDAVLKEGADRQWWKNFNDPTLDMLVEKADSGNLDVKIAAARIAEARSSVNLTEAALLPQGDIKGTATREANQMALPGGSTSGFGPLLHKPFNIFQAGFDASWEIDLFGGARRAQERAEAELGAAQASAEDVRVTMMAEVARTYVEIRAAQAQQQIAADTVAADENTLSIARQRFKAGLAPELDVTQAEGALEQAKGDLPAQRAAVAQAEYAMDVLLGEQPGAARKLIAQAAPIPAAPEKIALDAPAAVIAQRPDIRAAERRLAAATAQQGVAVAQFFPRLSLSGFFGALNTDATQLLTGGSESWLGSGGIIWPILNYGTLSANLDTANAQQQEAMLTYHKTVLSALADVEKALSAYTEQEKTLAAADAARGKAAQARAVAAQRYKAGITTFLDVLDADRTLYAAQKQEQAARAQAAENLVALYKALGGGWRKS